MITDVEFCSKLLDIAENYKTLYVMGCFGAPMSSKNKLRYTNNNAYNKKSSRSKMIASATEDTYGFDCVCLIKGVLWGWEGNKNKTYGGASYGSNNVPDIGADQMINVCSSVSSDFNHIVMGEAVWLKGHIGVYIGNGLVVECTPKWNNKVQISHLGNLKEYQTGNYRKWTKHGRLPYIVYTTNNGTSVFPIPTRTIYKGCKGQDVMWVQEKLQLAGYSEIIIDGSCGAKTDKAIRKFQTSVALQADGRVGALTRSALSKIN